MRLLLVVMMTASLYAVDIHQHGTVVSCIPLPEENPTIISFSNGIVFDTRDGQPTLPEHLMINDYNGEGYYLVQLKGPVYTEWLDALKGAGLDIVTYIPKYAVVARASQEQVESASQFDFVQWTGIFQPAYKLQEELLNKTGTGRVSIQLFPNTDVNGMVQQIEQLGFAIAEVVDHPLCQSIDAVIDYGRVHEIARLTRVHWIQVWTEPAIANSNSQWVCQTGWRSSTPSDPGARRVWYQGVRGEGTILGVSDTGVRTTHNMFYDAAYPINSAGIFPNHRKIVGYRLYSTAAFGDVGSTYHGSHVCGTVAGNDTLLGASLYDGIAENARLYFVDLCDAGGGFVITTNLAPMYDTIHNGGGLPYHILQHSASWRWYHYDGTYLLQEATTDAHAYRNIDFLNLYAAGNEGSGAMTIGDPSCAKNILTIGATANGTSSNTIAGFSSRGPTQDNRIKPNLCAPGVTIWSVDGSGNTGYKPLDGTSMATPGANGSLGLIRQYLLAGYYPSGAANPPDSIKFQSAALLRAMAMVSCDPNIGSYVPPSYDMGWGRIDVDSVLYFATDARKLIIKDDTVGVSTAGAIIDSFQVNSSIPLRICVAWIDTAAAPNANPTLINDLNALLTAPGGTYYRGNQYTSGQSTSNPGSWDNRNVEECFRVNAPATGKWKLQINGQSVPNGPMGYAFAVTGDIQPIFVGVGEYDQGVTGRETFTHNSISSGRVDLVLNLTKETSVNARILDLSGRVVEEIINKVLPSGETCYRHGSNLSSGVYFVEIRTKDSHEVNKLVIVR